MQMIGREMKTKSNFVISYLTVKGSIPTDH